MCMMQSLTSGNSDNWNVCQNSRYWDSLCKMSHESIIISCDVTGRLILTRKFRRTDFMNRSDVGAKNYFRDGRSSHFFKNDVRFIRCAEFISDPRPAAFIPGKTYRNNQLEQCQCHHRLPPGTIHATFYDILFLFVYIITRLIRCHFE